MRRALLVPLTVLLAAAASACQPTTSPNSPFDPAYLTQDSGDVVGIYGLQAYTVVHAPPSNTGGNTRIAWTLLGAPSTVDHTTCATWDASSTDPVQEGVMLRWNGTTGISVTKNIWGGVYTTINIHQWDLGNTATPFTMVAQFNLPSIVAADGSPKPLPWRMCATAAAGSVSFKVWPTSDPTPADGDPCCSGSTPVTDLGPGRPGWYAGHIQPGHVLAYRDLTTETP